MVDSSEKRDFKRMVVDCQVEYSRVGAHAVERGMIRNLSASGMLLVCPQEISMGERLEVNIRPERPLVPPLEAEVEVVRVQPGSIAQEFEIACKIMEMKT